MKLEGIPFPVLPRHAYSPSGLSSVILSTGKVPQSTMLSPLIRHFRAPLPSLHSCSVTEYLHSWCLPLHFDKAPWKQESDGSVHHRLPNS